MNLIWWLQRISELLTCFTPDDGILRTSLETLFHFGNSLICQHCLARQSRQRAPNGMERQTVRLQERISTRNFCWIHTSCRSAEPFNLEACSCSSRLGCRFGGIVSVKEVSTWLSFAVYAYDESARLFRPLWTEFADITNDAGIECNVVIAGGRYAGWDLTVELWLGGWIVGQCSQDHRSY